jgi:NAD(P)-dependent dehydrogenase (short-subunit alcohol dehydrogenase family)
MSDLWGYQGQRVIVTGAASGMGAAVVRTLSDLGAEVTVLDVVPVSAPHAAFIQVDLGDRASIETAATSLAGTYDALFNCAGVPGPPKFSNHQTMLVNFVGLRHFTEAVLPMLKDGGAIASISSNGGLGWQRNLDNVRALLDLTRFEEASKWCEEHPDVANGYLFSKQMIIGYTKRRAHELVERGIRMNCILPAPTETPMLPSFHAQVSKEFIDDNFRAPIGRDATPEEMAEPLVFLNSQAARFISGVSLIVDFGYEGAIAVGDKQGLL